MYAGINCLLSPSKISNKTQFQNIPRCEMAFGLLIYDGVMELGTPIVVEFPSRWATRSKEHSDPVTELSHLATVIVRGCEAVAGTYMRLTDLIRSEGLTDAQVRKALEPHFPPSRICEILRVSRASEEVYRRYRAGFFGFKAALHQCRNYTITPGTELQRRKIRRTAERLLVLLGGAGQVSVRGHIIAVSKTA